MCIIKAIMTQFCTILHTSLSHIFPFHVNCKTIFECIKTHKDRSLHYTVAYWLTVQVGELVFFSEQKNNSVVSVPSTRVNLIKTEHYSQIKHVLWVAAGLSRILTGIDEGLLSTTRSSFSSTISSGSSVTGGSWLQQQRMTCWAN